jgi:hypothetical protein
MNHMEVKTTMHVYVYITYDVHDGVLIYVCSVRSLAIMCIKYLNIKKRWKQK